MSTNFIQWNSAALNQETDAEYLADAQRIGGVTTGSLAPSATMNKFYYQASTFIAAFGQMLATKGYSNSDASLPTLAAVLANVLTEADMGAQIVSVPYSPTPAFNAAGNNGFQMTLTGNITASTISGVSPGQLLAFYFVQDSVGGRTVSWPSSFVGALQPDAAASSVSVMLFRSDLSGTVRAVSPSISNNGIFAMNGLFCPTRSPGDNTTNAATTAFVKQALAASFTSGSNANGRWVKDPTGHIHQWGTISGSIVTGSTITFPTPFTDASSVSVVPTSITIFGHGIGFISVQSGTVTTTQCQVEVGATSPTDGMCWIADGV